MYLIVDLYGAVYKVNNLNISLENMADKGDITIIEIQECNNPKVFVDDKWFDVELQEN